MKACNHYRKSGLTSFGPGIIEATCYGCGKAFYFPIDTKPHLWIIERIHGIITAVKIFETIKNIDGTTSLKAIESDCCKYK